MKLSKSSKTFLLLWEEVLQDEIFSGVNSEAVSKSSPNFTAPKLKNPRIKLSKLRAEVEHDEDLFYSNYQH